VLFEEEGVLWVASPDDDELVELAAGTLEVSDRLSVEGGPSSLARDGGRLAVALARASALVFIDDVSDAVTRRVPIPCGSSSSVAFAADGAAFVACPFDRRVVRVDHEQVTHAVEVDGKPTALAVVNDILYVSLSEVGRIERFDVAEVSKLSPLNIDLAPGFSASQLDSLVPVDGGVTAAYQLVDRDSDRSRPPEAGGYGDVHDDNPRIQPRLTGVCAGGYARYDGGAAVFSGPSAVVFDPDHRLLWVAHQYTNNVALLACGNGDQLAVRGSFRVGRGARGIALSADGSTAYVDVGFDYAVARLELGAAEEGRVSAAAATLRRPDGVNVFSDSAQAGRALFHDAVNTHLTPSGVVTCATCHPGGDDDGLSWFLHTETVPRKLRRTLPGWAGRLDAAPYHWDAEFNSARALIQETIIGLMDGDALLIDFDAIVDYLDEIPIPKLYVSEADRALLDMGQALFADAEVGCSGCHSGELFSDGLLHEVVSETEDADATLAPSQTPSLRAVWSRPPFLHDGRASTLESVLSIHNEDDNHGHTSELSPGEVDALLAYLKSL